MRVVLSLGFVLLLTQCGARSSLPIDDTSSIGGAAGIGGSSTGGTATGGAGGTGGGGGMGGMGGSIPKPECTQLVMNVPIATIDPSGPGLDSRAQLVRVDADDVTAVFTRETALGTELRHASFVPWKDWTESVGTTFATLPGAFSSLTFAAGTGDQKHFPVLIGHSDVVPMLSKSVSAWGNGGAPELTAYGHQAVFVVNGELGAVAGTRNENEVFVNLPSKSSVYTAACATGPTFADGEAVGNEWFVAFSTGYPQDEFCGYGIPLGAPERIDVQRVICEPGLCLSTSSLTSIDVGVTVEALVTARHSDGIWVVWEVQGGEPRIEWARFSESTGDVLRGQVSQPGDVPLAFAADSLGDSLVVVWGNDPADNPADLNVTVLNDQGKVTASASIEPPFAGPISVVGSPGEDAITVAWSDGAAQRVRLARFDCL